MPLGSTGGGGGAEPDQYNSQCAWFRYELSYDGGQTYTGTGLRVHICSGDGGFATSRAPILGASGLTEHAASDVGSNRRQVRILFAATDQSPSASAVVVQESESPDFAAIVVVDTLRATTLDVVNAMRAVRTFEDDIDVIAAGLDRRTPSRPRRLLTGAMKTAGNESQAVLDVFGQLATQIENAVSALKRAPASRVNGIGQVRTTELRVELPKSSMRSRNGR